MDTFNLAQTVTYISQRDMPRRCPVDCLLQIYIPTDQHVGSLVVLRIIEML